MTGSVVDQVSEFVGMTWAAGGVKRVRVSDYAKRGHAIGCCPPVFDRIEVVIHRTDWQAIVDQYATDDGEPATLFGIPVHVEDED